MSLAMLGTCASSSFPSEVTQSIRAAICLSARRRKARRAEVGVIYNYNESSLHTSQANGERRKSKLFVVVFGPGQRIKKQRVASHSQLRGMERDGR
mmetsp:Transcript_17546/g.32239  ORF Transcript_17546/g.32239 Transcript_17546/m.32239 type:complete len:96 (-) Transcript_17546:957-1244(-)